MPKLPQSRRPSVPRLLQTSAGNPWPATPTAPMPILDGNTIVQRLDPPATEGVWQWRQALPSGEPSQTHLITGCGDGRVIATITYVSDMPIAETVGNSQLIARASCLLQHLRIATLAIYQANQEGNPILSAWLPEASRLVRQALGGN